MTAQRTTVRDALKQALTGLVHTGSHVFIGRTRPLTAAELPAILIFSGSQEVTDYDLDGLPSETRWQLRTDVLVREGEGSEAIADEILAAMVAAVAASAPLNQNQCSSRFVGTGEVDLDDATEKPALRLPVIFEVTTV